MKNKVLIVFLLLLHQESGAQTLSETQMRNARATGYAIVAARNPGVPFSIYMLEWDGVNTLEHNATTRINAGWHAQAVIKGNFFYQEFDGSDFSQYSSVILSQEQFDMYKHAGTQWWIVCSTLSPFSNSITSQDGNVGIGINSPIHKLDVNGTTNFRGSLVLNDNTLYLTTGGDYLSGIVGSGNTNLYTRGQLVLSSNGNNIGQQLLLQNNGVTALAVVPGGNIGIGTTSPTQKLSVNGNIAAKKLIVSQTGWPDYVFDPSYKLKPLSELSAFIQQYKHLPDLPSAKEVAEKGISVGDNQALLLKKIEELTLYMISQNKLLQNMLSEQTKLKSENQGLKNQIKKINLKISK